MSLVEALGFGLPAISTFVGGTAEVVKDGECGILCEPGDIQALTRALEKLVNDKALRVSMGRAGWERAQDAFSPKVVYDKLEKCYKEL
jgi:glycosyltransferase involved in cell wall biosynthesis